jgi:hypothetical protein
MLTKKTTTKNKGGPKKKAPKKIPVKVLEEAVWGEFPRITVLKKISEAEFAAHKTFLITTHALLEQARVGEVHNLFDDFIEAAPTLTARLARQSYKILPYLPNIALIRNLANSRDPLASLSGLVKDREILEGIYLILREEEPEEPEYLFSGVIEHLAKAENIREMQKIIREMPANFKIVRARLLKMDVASVREWIIGLSEVDQDNPAAVLSNLRAFMEGKDFSQQQKQDFVALRKGVSPEQLELLEKQKATIDRLAGPKSRGVPERSLDQRLLAVKDRALLREIVGGELRNTITYAENKTLLQGVPKTETYFEELERTLYDEDVKTYLQKVARVLVPYLIGPYVISNTPSSRLLPDIRQNPNFYQYNAELKKNYTEITYIFVSRSNLGMFAPGDLPHLQPKDLYYPVRAEYAQQFEDYLEKFETSVVKNLYTKYTNAVARASLAPVYPMPIVVSFYDPLATCDPMLLIQHPESWMVVDGTCLAINGLIARVKEGNATNPVTEEPLSPETVARIGLYQPHPGTLELRPKDVVGDVTIIDPKTYDLMVKTIYAVIPVRASAETETEAEAEAGDRGDRFDRKGFMEALYESLAEMEDRLVEPISDIPDVVNPVYAEVTLADKKRVRDRLNAERAEFNKTVEKKTHRRPMLFLKKDDDHITRVALTEQRAAMRKKIEEKEIPRELEERLCTYCNTVVSDRGYKTMYREAGRNTLLSFCSVRCFSKHDVDIPMNHMQVLADSVSIADGELPRTAPLDIDEDLFSVDTAPDGSCFFHAIAMAVIPRYRFADAEDKRKLVVRMRRMIADKLTLVRWGEVGDGVLARLLTMEKLRGLEIPELGEAVEKRITMCERVPFEECIEMIKTDVPTRVKEIDGVMREAYNAYKQNLASPDVFADEIFLDVTAEFVGHNIFVLNANTGEITRRTALDTDDVVLLYYLPDDEHYEVVGREPFQLVFNKQTFL